VPFVKGRPRSAAGSPSAAERALARAGNGEVSRTGGGAQESGARATRRRRAAVRGLSPLLVASVGLTLVCAGAMPACAQTISLPKITIEPASNGSPEEIATGLQIVLLLTVLTVAPAILLLLTSFTRIIIVLSLVRQAIGVQQLPPNQVIVGLALFLTLFVMAPVGEQIHQNAYQPYMAKEISQGEALARTLAPLREFMLRQTRETDLALMVRLSESPAPRTSGDLPTTVIVPAFALSEIKTAFQIGFVLFVPFLVIDMVVASVLMSMGMMMLPPIVISLPFKILLFVLADGWHLVVRALVTGFR
jgi:flagellar biosynthetic protein FliP